MASKIEAYPVSNGQLMNTFCSYSSDLIGEPLLLAGNDAFDGAVDLLVTDRAWFGREEDFAPDAFDERRIAFLVDELSPVRVALYPLPALTRAITNCTVPV